MKKKILSSLFPFLFIIPAAYADTVDITFEFGFRECTMSSDSSSNLLCEEKIALKRVLPLELMPNGGECVYFGETIASTPPTRLQEQTAHAKTPAKMIAGLLTASRERHQAQPSTTRKLQEASLGCAYGVVGAYDETYLPLVLIETDATSEKSTLLLSLARSSEATKPLAAEPQAKEILTQIESTEVLFKDLQTLQENPNVSLRAREIIRSKDLLIFPFFRVSNAERSAARAKQ